MRYGKIAWYVDHKLFKEEYQEKREQGRKIGDSVMAGNWV